MTKADLLSLVEETPDAIWEILRHAALEAHAGAQSEVYEDHSDLLDLVRMEGATLRSNRPSFRSQDDTKADICDGFGWYDPTDRAVGALRSSVGGY